jgi:cytidine deaminase
MSQALTLPDAPELVFGLVAPIGVDLDLVTDVLDHALQEMSYRVHTLRLTALMREVPTDIQLKETSFVERYTSRIEYANEVRYKLGNEALASLAISAIRAFRAQEWERRASAHNISEATNAGEKEEEIPLPSQAYVLRQIKRPEEVTLLRSVYGRQFVLVSAFAGQAERIRRIEELERQSCGGLISSVAITSTAQKLVLQDDNEKDEPTGQNVRDAFPLGDVFIDATNRLTCEQTIRRFVSLFYGSNEITPTHDEYGMYIAKSASLRSSDLSRQVGAAIFRPSGEVVSMGCNEVPKAGGGTYWAGDARDSRDIAIGFDANELHKIEVLVDLLDRLKKGNHLSTKLMEMTDTNQIGKELLADNAQYSIAESKLMDLIEFGRSIHAEMSAISDASRKGISVEDGTLYCTTFPCHICAKHIVAAGIRCVVYLEPYPKSYASQLHRDSITLERDGSIDKVLFEAFIGVSPYRYRDLFEKGKRKYGGVAQRWNKGTRRPMIEVYLPTYSKAETQVVASLKHDLELIISRT